MLPQRPNSITQTTIERPRVAKKAADRWYDKGDDMREAGDLAGAEAAYRAALSHDPNHLSALNDLGITLHDLDRLDEAIATLRRALEVDPNYLHALNNLANALQDTGEEEEAIETYQRALAADPEYVEGMSNMAVALHEQGRDREAGHWFREVLKRDPENATARHLAAALGGETTRAPPEAYVADLFDDYAERFEDELLDNLGYRAPAVLGRMVRRIAGSRRFAHAIDLGCGTGLLGREVRALADKLWGVDLSAEMIKLAGTKKIYDRLARDDVARFLARSRSRFDLLLAADVFIYVGDLDPVFAAAAGRARPGALFAFSLEAGGHAGYRLAATGRYQHAKRYMDGLAREYGMRILAYDRGVLRQEQDGTLAGHYYVLEIP